MKKRTTREILLSNQQRKSSLSHSFILWLHNIRSLHNVGAAFRSADAFGVSRLWLSGFTPVPPRPEITKTAIGAEEHVSWRQVDDINTSVKNLNKKGYQIVGLEQTHSSISLAEFNPAGNHICLILGNEVTGIDEQLLPHLHQSVEIPQFGVKHSLNVSVAAGVALYSFQEKLKGLKIED